MNIVIAEDQPLLRDTLKTYLENQGDLKVINTVSNGQQAVDICKTASPDLIIMDVKMPILNGIEATKIIKIKFPHIKVLILTLYENKEDLLRSIEVGADGYLLKDIEPEVLINSINIINMGISVFKQGVLKGVYKNINPLIDTKKVETIEEFTSGELQVIHKICEGKKNQTIADEIGCSLGTVKNRVGSILAKANLTDRTQIVIHAIKNGLLT